jgi:PII-like signaling protein
MKLEGVQTLLRVFLRNTEKYSWWSLMIDKLLKCALKHKMEGATVFEGILGLDATGRLIESGRWALVQRQMAVVEFFDCPLTIGAFLPDVCEIVRYGTITLEGAHVLAYRRRDKDTNRIRSHFPIPDQPATEKYLPSAEEFPIMRQIEDGQLLRIFIDDSDRYQNQPLFKAIIAKAKELGLANAIVLRAPKVA